MLVQKDRRRALRRAHRRRVIAHTYRKLDNWSWYGIAVDRNVAYDSHFDRKVAIQRLRRDAIKRNARKLADNLCNCSCDICSSLKNYGMSRALLAERESRKDEYEVDDPGVD